jgi:hypothetical protein
MSPIPVHPETPETNSIIHIYQEQTSMTRQAGKNHYDRKRDVKSVSIASTTASTASAFSQVQEARTRRQLNHYSDSASNMENSQSGLLPHGQAAPVTGWFSLVARSQVHCPAGRAP